MTRIGMLALTAVLCCYLPTVRTAVRTIADTVLAAQEEPEIDIAPTWRAIAPEDLPDLTEPPAPLSVCEDVVVFAGPLPPALRDCRDGARCVSAQPTPAIASRSLAYVSIGLDWLDDYRGFTRASNPPQPCPPCTSEDRER